MEKKENSKGDFAGFNERMGLSGAASTHDLQKIAGKASLFSSDSTSDVKPTMIPVNAIDNFAGLGGGKKFPERNIKEVAYFASEGNFVIDQEITVDVSKAPMVWNYDTITFKPGGSINVNGSYDFTINCISMFKE